MPTKRCPSCGDEFIAAVASCPDCGVDLVPTDDTGDDAAPDDDREILDGGAAEQIAYDLAGWSEEQRVHVDRLLVDVPHAWQGTDLLVPPTAQDAVDELVDRIEVEVELALDPAADKLAYEVGDLADDQLLDLIDSLVAERIHHQYLAETDEIVVHEADEEAVEVIFDRFDFPDALPVDDGADGEGAEVDGLEVQEVLGDLFVAADRLKSDGDDPEGLLGFFDASQRLDSFALPYGFDRREWEGLRGEVTALRLLIEADDGSPAADADAVAADDGTEPDDEPIGEPDDGAEADPIAECAERVRTLLRRYV